MAKEMSPGEKAEKERAEKVKATLSWNLMQEIIGGGEIKGNPTFYGQLYLNGGEATYEGAKGSEDYFKEFQKARKDKMGQKSGLEKKLGMSIPESPTVSDFDVVGRLYAQFTETTHIAKLGELEKYTKELGGKIQEETPEELKGYSASEANEESQKILKKYADAEGKVEMSKVSEADKAQLNNYNYVIARSQTLANIYVRAAALKAGAGNTYTDLNDQETQITEMIKPKEKGK